MRLEQNTSHGSCQTDRAVTDVKIALFEKIVLLLHPHVDVPYSLVVTLLELGWRIVSTWLQEWGICTSLPSLIVGMEAGKRHALRAHIPEAATDWLNPLCLGTISASAYIDNLA